jgi:hypothetical protein
MPERFSRTVLRIAGGVAVCLAAVLGIWVSHTSFKSPDPGDGIFYEADLPGTGTNCIFVQLPPLPNPPKRRSLWARLSPFQVLIGKSGGPVALTRLMKDVSIFGRFHHVLVTESLFREYGHDPVEFLPPRFSYSVDYPGAKTIRFLGAGGTGREVYARVHQSLINSGIEVVAIRDDIALLVPQKEVTRYAAIKAGALRRREALEIKVVDRYRGDWVRLERSVAGSRWLPYSPPFTNWHQFDRRLVVDFGPEVKWRVHPLTALGPPLQPLESAPYGGMTSAELIENLSSRNVTARWRSAEVLARRKEAPEQVLPVLMEAVLFFWHPAMQTRLLEAVGEYRERAREALPVVMAFATDPEAGERVGYVLSAIDPGLAANPGEEGSVPLPFPKLVAALKPQLHEGLKSTNRNIRISSAWVLSAARETPDEVVPVLLDILRGNKDIVAQRTVEALAAWGPRAHPDLLKALEAPNIPLRLGAASALAMQKAAAEKAIPALLSAHRYYLDPGMKKRIRGFIAQYGNEARGVLESAAQDPELGPEARAALANP